MAEDNSEFVFGFICQKKLTENPAFIHITPGIQFNKNTRINESLGQQYTTPEIAIIKNKCDIIVVGRGILNSDDPVKTALEYKMIAYELYVKRLNF